ISESWWRCAGRVPARSCSSSPSARTAGASPSRRTSTLPTRQASRPPAPPGSRSWPSPAGSRPGGSSWTQPCPSISSRGRGPQPLAKLRHTALIAGMNSRQETPAEWQGEARRIKLHGPEAFEAMRKAGHLAALTLDFITPHVREGGTTGTLDKLCHDFIVDHQAIPAPLNYRGFPKSICTSINHVVCHGIPGERKLVDGDTLNIDVTVILDGWHGDTSRMFFVGRPSVKAQRLVDATYRAMMAGIATVKPGSRLGDIGEAIQCLAEGERFSVVRDFCGHGIGRIFHDAPSVLHFGRAGTGP